MLFFRSSLERILYVVPVQAGVVSDRNLMVQKRQNKTAFCCAGPNFNLNTHCFVRFASFAAFTKRPTVYRAVDQQWQYQAQPMGCAGYGLVTKFSSKITNVNSSLSKPKLKLKLMQSGISNEGALNRPFPFTLGMNNPSKSDS